MTLDDMIPLVRQALAEEMERRLLGDVVAHVYAKRYGTGLVGEVYLSSEDGPGLTRSFLTSEPFGGDASEAACRLLDEYERGLDVLARTSAASRDTPGLGGSNPHSGPTEGEP